MYKIAIKIDYVLYTIIIFGQPILIILTTKTGNKCQEEKFVMWCKIENC